MNKDDAPSVNSYFFNRSRSSVFNRSKSSVFNCSNIYDFKQHGLKCIYTNADSLLNKLDEFKNRFLSEKVLPNIIAFTEVIPKNMCYDINKAEIDLEGYDLLPSNFSGTAKRGIYVYVKRSLKATEMEFTSDFKESVWVKIPLLNKDNLLFGCIYKSPSSDEANHKDLNLILSQACTQPRNISHILITGDFNFPDVKWNSWSASKEFSLNFLECIRDNYLHQMIEKPTRIRSI